MAEEAASARRLLLLLLQGVVIPMSAYRSAARDARAEEEAEILEFKLELGGQPTRKDVVVLTIVALVAGAITAFSPVAGIFLALRIFVPLSMGLYQTWRLKRRLE